ncbi:DUF7768 domain-containing protein [Clostridium butyricum]|uniref:DUF7768 domain-containing protein n=1 Tax=Clostridium butyricum TaxID=1492 RepID=UPI00374FB170
MGINKYNTEGYYDPTTYEALTRISIGEKAEKKSAFRPLVYICSPFSGDIENNITKARRFCRFALEQNTIPIAMHLLLPQFMDDGNPKERELAMHFNYVVLGKCNELWVLGSAISSGMEHEIYVAKKRKQKIRWFDDNFQEVVE